MNKRQTKKIIGLLFSALLAVVVFYAGPQISQVLGEQTNSAPVQPGYFRVVEFHDGDTFSVNMNGKTERIRLIGIDTPETHKPNAPVQCFGPEASDFTKKLVGTQDVRLEADPTGDNRDRYDRLLRYAYLPDNTLVNQKIIEEGYGFAYTSFKFTKKNDFVAAQISARNAGKGLWSACSFTEKNGRFQTNNLN